jgi:hypothetical protein
MQFYYYVVVMLEYNKFLKFILDNINTIINKFFLSLINNIYFLRHNNIEFLHD